MWRDRWLSARALRCHALLAIWVPGCLVAGWWQVTVALSGDHLAWLYSVEWPVFALFGGVVWWHLLHDDPNSVGLRGLRRAKARAAAAGELVADAALTVRRREEEDEDLAAYNDYLESLHAADADRPGSRT